MVAADGLVHQSALLHVKIRAICFDLTATIEALIAIAVSLSITACIWIAYRTVGMSEIRKIVH